MGVRLLGRIPFMTESQSARVNPPILIANATDADAATVVAMYRRVLEEGRWFITYPDEFKGTEASQAKIIREWNQEPNSRFMVARIGTRIVGAISVTGGNKDRIKHVGMIEVFVDRNARGQGVGRALMEAAMVWADNNPILRKLSLHVFEDNLRAVALYKNLGLRSRAAWSLNFRKWTVPLETTC